MHRAALAAALLSLGVAACGAEDEGSSGRDVASLDADTDADAGSNTGANGSTNGGGTDAEAAPTDPEDAMVAFAQCMREHGVDMPDPQGGPGGGVIVVEGTAGAGGIADDDLMAAQEACQPIMDAAMGAIEVDPEVHAEQREQMLEFAQCMREHGVDMPDPEFEGGGVSIEIGAAGGPGAPDEEWQAANEACRDLLGGPVGGAG